MEDVSALKRPSPSLTPVASVGRLDSRKVPPRLIKRERSKGPPGSSTRVSHFLPIKHVLWLVAPRLSSTLYPLVSSLRTPLPSDSELVTNQNTLTPELERAVGAHRVSWSADSRASSPCSDHWNGDGLIGQSCLPDKIHPDCHVTHATETKQLCTFSTRY